LSKIEAAFLKAALFFIFLFFKGAFLWKCLKIDFLFLFSVLSG